jgi:short-subunit dehydrogenase
LKIVIVGASSSIAEHCARHWLVNGPHEFVLVGRDRGRLERVGADLQVRDARTRVSAFTLDLTDAKAIEVLVREICDSGKVDVVLVAHGSLPDQQACQDSLPANLAVMLINGASPVLIAEAFAGRMAAAGGTVAVIGSVAGDRGRKSNYVYGAAKGLVSRYVEGMQHRFAGTRLRVVLIKPGPTDTPMTALLKAQGMRLAPVEQVARTIVGGIAAGRPVVYAPAKWRLIMLIIRHLPRFIFHRLNI